MKKTKWMIGPVLATLLCSACVAAESQGISGNIHGAEVHVVIRHVRDAKSLNVRGVAVYGEAVIKSGRLRSANLDCVLLSTDGAQSSKPYVDRVAHIMTKNYPADTDGVVRADLYWVFSELDMSQVESHRLALKFDQSRGPCVTRD